MTQEEYYKIAYKTTIDCRTKYFQYICLNDLLCNNVQLKKWNIEEDNRCEFLNKEPETVVHLFWSCEAIQSYWRGFGNYFSYVKRYSNRSQCFLVYKVLSYFKKIFPAKWFVHSCKYKNSLPQCICTICTLCNKNLELIIAQQNNTELLD